MGRSRPNLLMRSSNSPRPNPELPRSSAMRVEVFGEARGSRALAGVGIVIRDETGRELTRHSLFLGVATPVQAEYRAIIEGLRSCSNLPAPAIVMTSHQAAMRQILGNSSAHVPETAH